LDRWVGKAVIKGLGWYLKVEETHGIFPKEQIQRILLIRPGGLGDAVLLAPMIDAVRTHYEGAVLEILAEVRNGDIFRCEGSLADRLYFYDRGVDLFRVLRRSYDLIIDTEQSHYLSALVARLIQAKYRVGFGTNERRILFHRRVDYCQEDYEINSFLHLMEAITGATFSFHPDRPFFPKPGKEEEFKTQESVSPKKPMRVLMAPGATIPERKWGWEKYRELVKRFLDRGVEVVLIGGPMDRSESKHITDHLVGPLVDLTGQTSLNDLWKVIGEGDLLISCDTGVLHLAYGVGTPSLSLFGAGSEVKWAPKGKRHRSINKHFSCSPCTVFGVTPPCPIEVACLETISVEEVEEAAWKLLKEIRS